VSSSSEFRQERTIPLPQFVPNDLRSRIEIPTFYRFSNHFVLSIYVLGHIQVVTQFRLSSSRLYLDHLLAAESYSSFLFLSQSPHMIASETFSYHQPLNEPHEMDGIIPDLDLGVYTDEVCATSPSTRSAPWLRQARLSYYSCRLSLGWNLWALGYILSW
jgi:hypothetical protein